MYTQTRIHAEHANISMLILDSTNLERNLEITPANSNHCLHTRHDVLLVGQQMLHLQGKNYPISPM